MFKFSIIVIVTAVLHAEVYGFNKLPSYMKLCSRSDPNLNECALQSGRDAIPSVVEGDPKYHIPCFNPFKFEKISLEASSNIKLYSTDVEMYGFENAQLNYVHWNLDEKVVTVNVLIPKFEVKAQYNMHGHLMIMNLDGSGPMFNTFDQVNLTMVTYYDLVEKNDKVYMKIKNIRLQSALKGAHFNFGNLLNNPQLSVQMNAFLNENWQVLVEELLPSSEQVLEDTFLAIITPILDKVPFDAILKP